MESIFEIRLDSAGVPDQSNCDFSSYKDYSVSGGVLLSSEQFVPLRSHSMRAKIPVVCDYCMREPKVKTLVDLIGARK